MILRNGGRFLDLIAVGANGGAIERLSDGEVKEKKANGSFFEVERRIFV
ncbi:hypothetical protein [Dyella japonica]|nr:hypothetical protein [Dyella japonica]